VSGNSERKGGGEKGGTLPPGWEKKKKKKKKGPAHRSFVKWEHHLAARAERGPGLHERGKRGKGISSYTRVKPRGGGRGGGKKKRSNAWPIQNEALSAVRRNRDRSLGVGGKGRSLPRGEKKKNRLLRDLLGAPNSHEKKKKEGEKKGRPFIPY